MRIDEADRAKIHADPHEASSRSGAGSAELDEPLSVDLDQLQRPQLVLEHPEGGVLRASRRPTDLLHVIDVQIDKFAEGGGSASAGPRGRAAEKIVATPSGLPDERQALHVKDALPACDRAIVWRDGEGRRLRQPLFERDLDLAPG